MTKVTCKYAPLVSCVGLTHCCIPSTQQCVALAGAKEHLGNDVLMCWWQQDGCWTGVHPLEVCGEGDKDRTHFRPMPALSSQKAE